MPELPEVETTRRGVAKHVCGQNIKKVTVRNAKLRQPVPKSLANQLKGQMVKRIERRGKYLLFQIDSGTMIVHLGMSGSLRLVNHDVPLKKHDHVEWLLDNDLCLRYNDPRRFGLVLWTKDDPLGHSLLSHLGPEPLTNDFTEDYIFQLAKKRKTAVKAFIMDSKVVVGVGNIYAQEALFYAGIHPQRGANKISLKRYEVLVAEIKKILAKAIKQGGTTLRDFIQADGKPGYFSQSLAVYGRGGERCKICNSILKISVIAQRTTVYCSRCQRF